VVSLGGRGAGHAVVSLGGRGAGHAVVSLGGRDAGHAVVSLGGGGGSYAISHRGEGGGTCPVAPAHGGSPGLTWGSMVAARGEGARPHVVSGHWSAQCEARSETPICKNGGLTAAASTGCDPVSDSHPRRGAAQGFTATPAHRTGWPAELEYRQERVSQRKVAVPVTQHWPPLATHRSVHPREDLHAGELKNNKIKQELLREGSRCPWLRLHGMWSFAPSWGTAGCTAVVTSVGQRGPGAKWGHCRCGDHGHSMDFSVLPAKDRFVAPGARGAGVRCINNDYVCVQNNLTLLKLSDYKRGFGRWREQNFFRYSDYLQNPFMTDLWQRSVGYRKRDQYGNII